MARAIIRAAALSPITYTLAAGYQDDGSAASKTEVVSIPLFVTSIIIKTNKDQRLTRFLAMYDVAQASDVTLGTTVPRLVIPYGPEGQNGFGVTTVTGVFSKAVQKVIFPGGGIPFHLGAQAAQLVMSTVSDATLASTTSLAEEILVYFYPMNVTY
jgi:hypothetical protein